MKDYLAVGKVVNTHGIKGELKVYPMTSDLSRFDYLLFVHAEWEGELKEFRVLSARPHKNMILIKLKGIDTMNDAEKFKGKELWVERKHARKHEEDEYFICDLIGLKVYENGEYIGSVTEVIQTGSNDVYIIKDPDKSTEILLPALKSVVKNVDIENNRMDVVVPEELEDEV